MESIKFEVDIPDNTSVGVVEIEYDDDVLTFRLNGKDLFRCDYAGNFQGVTDRMEEIWGRNE